MNFAGKTYCILLTCLAAFTIPSFAQIDSLKLELDSTRSRIDTLGTRVRGSLGSAKSKADSLRSINPLANAQHQVDSIQSQLSSRIQGLTNLNLPDSIVGDELKALRGQLDSIRGLVPINDLKQAQQRLTGIQASVNKRIAGAESRVNEKLSVFNKNGGNLPGNINIPKVNAGANLQVPGMSGQLPSLPGGSVPSMPGIKTPSLDGLSGKLPDVGGEKLKDIGIGDKLGDVKEKTASIGEVTQKIDGYSEDLKSLKDGNLGDVDKLPGELEKKVADAGGLDAYKDQLGRAKAMEKWSQDPEYLKELAFKQGKEQVTDHFAGHDKELLAAIDKLSAAKEKYAKVGGVVDMFEKPSNAMKEKPFIDRLQPGISLQFQSSQNQWFDFWPTIGYKWTGRITTGIGWNERVSYNFKKWKYIPEDRAFGPRGYAEFMLKNDFYVRAEAEFVNAPVTSPYILNQPDPPSRSWVWSYFGGIKKSFNLSGTVKGNVQTLYNLYNPLHRSPYTSRLVVRVGIEFPLKFKDEEEEE